MRSRALLYHGTSREAWEIAVRQGALRPARQVVRDGRIYHEVGRGGSICFTPEIDVAATYAGSEQAGRLLDVLPGRVANREGVVLAGEFAVEEAWAHDDYEHRFRDEIPTDRLQVVAHIPAGDDVVASAHASAALPPLAPDLAARLEAVTAETVVLIPGPPAGAFEALVVAALAGELLPAGRPRKVAGEK